MKRMFYLTLIILSVNGFGGFLDFDNIGNFSDLTDVKHFSLGNNTIFSVLNPSVFSGTYVMIDGGFGICNEERSKYVFDTYNNTIGKSVISRNSYQLFGPLGLFINLETDMFRIGFNYSPLILTNYRFYDVKMDEFYVIKSEEEMKKDISIYGYTPNFGIKGGDLKFGLFFSILNGKSYYYHRTNLDTIETKREYKGITFGGGMNYRFNKECEFGIYYNHDISVRSDSDSIIYPKKVSFGFDYNPSNILPAKFMIEFDYEFWGNAKVNGSEMDYSNVYIFKVGLEHKLASGLYARVGYTYKPHYSQNIPIGRFTTGLGFEVNRTFIDIGIAFESINFTKANIFYDEIKTSLKFSLRRNL